MNIETPLPTIRYLGNKRRLVAKIKVELSQLLPIGGTLVDLFSGSSSVGYDLLPNYRVISNDIEPYAYCIAKALVEDCGTILSSQEISTALDPAYKQNMFPLESAFRELIATERGFRKKSITLKEYKKHCTETPFINTWRLNGYSPQLKEIFELSVKKERTFPYVLFSTYFINSYFGVYQSLQIDSIRFAIDKLAGPREQPTDPILFHKLNTALMYTLSNCVSSPGHFAQPSFPNNKKMAARLIRERSKNIWDYFLHTVDRLFSEPRINHYNNRAYRLEAFDFIDHALAGMSKEQSLAIYIDPPYTADHYSRYYHVLNTLLLYDYPACVGKGRYRDNRYTSSFSMKSSASQELYRLLEKIKELHLPLILSYTSAGIVPVSEIASFCNQLFDKVKIVSSPLNYSSQGRKVFSEPISSDRDELLFVCDFSK